MLIQYRVMKGYWKFATVDTQMIVLNCQLLKLLSSDISEALEIDLVFLQNILGNIIAIVFAH